MSYGDRYASAIRSSRLVHHPDKEMDTDILGAMGLAAKRYPLSHHLSRLYLGDHSAERPIIEVLAMVALRRGSGSGLKPPMARFLASGVIAYHRSPKCGHCGGLGFRRMDGAPALSTDRCKPCKGSGQTPLRKFCGSRFEALGHELLGMVEREAGRAFGEAAACLKPNLHLALDLD